MNPAVSRRSLLRELMENNTRTLLRDRACLQYACFGGVTDGQLDADVGNGLASAWIDYGCALRMQENNVGIMVNYSRWITPTFRICERGGGGDGEVIAIENMTSAARVELPSLRYDVRDRPRQELVQSGVTSASLRSAKQ